MNAYGLESHPNDSRIKIAGDVVQTLSARMGTGGGNVPYILFVLTDTEDIAKDSRVSGHQEETQGGSEGLVVVDIGNGQVDDFYMHARSGTINCMHDQRMILDDKGVQMDRKYMIRRYTPLECCRLQGFPDWWEEDVPGSDSARYKMWGNGIALPCAYDVLARIAYMEETHGREN